ncbi:XRE family transcriptional regulator [Pantoea allii]|nr:helix-turn-helix transcriptional regulator [Pantoea allii]THB85387.1 XRE family transcriptional regulator [Pantoea allii]
MKSKTINGVAVEYSDGNVFADLGLPDADKLKVKSGLAAEIIRSVRRLELSQIEAGERMGINQAKVSNLLHGNFTNLSERKMMECLNLLVCDIEIVIKLSASGKGQLRLVQS